MKKSELLALLKRDIEDAANDLDLQARMVLARCESVGMLPPEAADFNIGNNWEPEEVETPYGKSIVEQVNTEIKELNKAMGEIKNLSGMSADIIIYDEIY